MLGALDIKYMPRTTVKRQVLEDFMVEFTEDIVGDERPRPSTLVVSTSSPATWEVYMDEAAN